ncbi:hypothetical protein CKF54_06245 [Psittacicella hinzii]|uniref:Uncharacterized protein n=1 Tax=Psittacicella hinzii TaxID=2028575 RepID=A0A3A1Y6M4_9GAMM|nr:hypothetical protein [Psittacicella hinzii]RIY31704.1 hypothetical protein CKF54_06245 [Psittacicella hinzii]
MVPAYLLNKYYLDNSSDVRQAGHMMLSFIFAYEDNCEVIFLNKGILNLIDISNIEQLLRVKETDPEVYNIILGDHLAQDLSAQKYVAQLVEKCKTLYTQWAMFTHEYESEKLIKFIITKEFCDEKVLNRIIKLIDEGKLELFSNIEFEYSNLSQVELEQTLKQYKWIYKA